MILLAQELYGYPLDPGVGGVQVLSRVPVVLPQSTYQGIKGGEHNTSLTSAICVQLWYRADSIRDAPGVLFDQ